MLAAPVINGTLPAFYSENGIVKITIPFSMNRSVNKAEIQAFSLKLKNVQGSSYLYTARSTDIDYINSTVSFYFIQDYQIAKEYKESRNYLYKKDGIYYELEIDSLDKFNEYLTEYEILYYYLDELSKLNVGMFYKAQLAYEDLSGTVGYYSTVGILKYTMRPDVDILGLEKSINNSHQYDYTGTYSQYKKDPTEKVYSYRFIVTDENENIVEDTGWIIHNNSTDTNAYESTDSFFFARDLIEGDKFKITYKVKTNNGLEVSSDSYRITSKKSLQSNLSKASLNLSLNFDNAYINISLLGEKDKFGYESPVRGYYILSRSSENSNYTQWEEIDRFTLASERPSCKAWKDFTIQQGVRYKYSIQQYNDRGLFSERIMSKEIYADFEHSFLYDGERQLKIMFNPKVSSFKIDHLEAKIDTIGSKFPFIFRNGNVEYKEFPISGLISYQSDEEGLFISKNNEWFKSGLREEQYRYKQIEINRKDYENDIDHLYLKRRNKYYLVKYIYENEEIYKNLYDTGLEVTHQKVWNTMLLNGEKFYIRLYERMDEEKFNNYKIKSFDLTAQNISLEREFKLSVLEWLTNGKPKLFKSPTEGNYLVRLMNVNLSPSDQVGRMLHTFTSTAYEIADNNYQSQIDLGIIKTNKDNDIYLKTTSILLSTFDDNYAKISHVNYVHPYKDSDIYYATGELVPLGVVLENFSISDLPPGTEIKVNSQKIIIGATGTYSSPIPVTSVIIPWLPIELSEKDFYQTNQKIYTYNEKNKKYEEASQFKKDINYYIPQTVHGVISMSYYTKVTNSFNSILDTSIRDVYAKQIVGYHENILKELEDIKTNVIAFYNIKAFNRPLEECYYVEQYIPETSSPLEDCENYWIYDTQTKTYIPASAEYNPAQTYYLKEIIYYSVNSGEELYRIREKVFRQQEFLLTANSNKLMAYYETKNQLSNFEMPLYKIIKFMDVGNSDPKGSVPPHRRLENRTSTNPLIMDITRDYDLLVQSKKLFYFDIRDQGSYRTIRPVPIDMPYQGKDENGEQYIYYCMGYDFQEITTPEDLSIKYMDAINYDDACDFFKIFNPDILKTVKTIYKKWEYRIEIDSRVFDLTDTGYHYTGGLDSLNSYLMGSGVYCEVYYQQQNIEYDISKNHALKIYKETLDGFDNILTREYMEQCIKLSTERKYIEDAKHARSQYKAIYNAYINELNQYLKSLEQGV